MTIGGGIVYDSDPYDEWMETMNKLLANMTCISEAEKRHAQPEEARKQVLAVKSEEEKKRAELVHPAGTL